jgi:anti-sigma B factor antagonist
MSSYRRLVVSEVGEVTVVRFADPKILDEVSIQEMGAELLSLVEKDNRGAILLNFAEVEFLSSMALGKLITLDKKVKTNNGKLKLCNIRPEIHEVFVFTKLTSLFDIKENEAQALAAF